MRKCLSSGASALAAICGLCVSAYGQDSVGLQSGGFGAAIGDAPASHEVSQQRTSYVVDLTPITTSWGNIFGVAPVVKGSQYTQPNQTDEFFTALLSAQSISMNMRTGVQAPSASYAAWQGAGPGVNPFRNSPAQTVAAPASVNQLALGFTEFALPENSSVVGAFINWRADQPGRLYITRMNCSTATDIPDGPSFSGHGYGSVDADGNIHFRADSFSSTGLSSRLIGSNWVYRVRMGQRLSTTLNVLDVTATRLFQLWADNPATTPFPGTPNLNNGNGLDDFDNDPTGIHDENATDAVVIPTTRAGTNPPSGTNNYAPPNVIPQAIAGRPVMISANFDMQYAYENVVGQQPAATMAHRPGTADHRGAVAYTTKQLFPGTSGSAGMLTRIGGNTTTDTRNIAVWGVNADGSVNGQINVTLASMISDPFDADPQIGGPFTLGRTVLVGQDYDGVADGVLFPGFYFDHYHSQTGFRGPTSQVAVGADLSGNALAAATVYFVGRDDTQPGNAIAVARFNPANPASVQWTLAAWNNYPGVGGKSIQDGNGNAIGRLVSFEDCAANNLRNIARSSNQRGPSISPPAFDAAGNVYFVSPIQIQRGADLDDVLDAPAPIVNGQPNPERDLFEIGLLRGVYDAQAFGYRLELVLRTGQVIAGANSGLDYMIDYMAIVDENSVNSGIFGSGNVTDAAFNGQTLASNTLTRSPDTLGGLVVAVDIVYDVDGQDTVNTPPLDYPIEVGGSGRFEDPTASSQGGPLFPNSQDQSYNVALFVGGVQAVPPCNCVRGQGDANGDCRVNGADLSVLLSQFGQAVPVSTGADFNADGQVNGADLSVLLSNFGCQ